MKIVGWVVCCAFLCGCTLGDDDGGLEEYIRQKIDHFQLRLHEAFEKHRLQRSRRDVGTYPSLDDNVLPREHFRISGARPANLGVHLANVTYWEPVDFNGASLMLRASKNGRLELLRWSSGGYVPFTGTETHVATTKSKAFVYGDQLWIVCLHHQFNVQGHFVRLYQLVGKTLVTKQTIALGGESDISVVRGPTSHYLVTCVFGKVAGSGVSSQGNVVLYEWKNTQFDAVSQHSVVGARSVVAWSMDGPLYIAVAQQKDDEKGIAPGSPVFIYNQRRERELSFVQVVRLWQATQVTHFAVAGVHYLAFLTKQGVVIYWYSGDQFLEWQTLLGTEDSVHVEVFHFPNGEAAIAVARQDEVMFFSETEMATYNRSFTARIPGSAIEKLAFQYLQGNYYLFATYALQQPVAHAPVQLVLEKYSSVPFTKKDPLLRCLHDLETLLSRRQKHVEKLAANIARVWTSDRPRPLAAELVVVDGPVKVLGSLSASKGVIVPGPQRVPQTQPSDVEQQLKASGDKVAALETGMKDVAFKSVSQTLKGNLKFTKPVTASKLQMSGMSDGAVNGVPMSRLLDKTLKISGDQVLQQPVTFASLRANSLAVRSINGVNMSDLMMTHRDQTVKGTFKLSHVRMADLFVAKGRTINGIAPEKIVTTDTPQAISGHKVFSKLNAVRDLNVLTTTNGRDLSEFVKHVVPLNGNSRITGQWRFLDPLSVTQGLNLKTPINGVFSIPKLVADAVDVGSTQVITGAKTYKAPVKIRGNLQVSGLFNGIKVDHDLVTLHGDQVVRGTWTFQDAVHFKGDLDARLINGLDLRKEAVLRNATGAQVVYGRKLFQADVGVQGDVIMTSGSTIDGVDPSELVRGTGMTTVYEGPVSIGNLVVQKDVVALKGINGRLLRDLKDLIWLRTADQEIKVPVKFNRVHLEGDLDTDSVNGINLDADLVKTFGDEVIEGPVVFKDSIGVRGPVDLAPGVKINGVDLSVASKRVVHAHRSGVIRGNVSFPSLIVENDVHCESVNGHSLARQFMLVNADQVVTGTHTYAQPVSVNHLHADSLSPVRLNGVQLKPFLDEVVPRSGPRRKPVINKVFAGGLRAEHVQAYGNIDGVDVNGMLESVVLLNVPQKIGGRKKFQSPLKLDHLLADKVNGIDIGKHVARVVRRDSRTVITGRKVVKGSVLVHGNLLTRGLVNGVNVKDMYARAMSKSRENLVTAPMVFSGGIEAGALHLYKPAKLDGIPVSNFVLLREDTELLGSIVFKSLLSDGHIKIRGLLNGCNITKLYEEAVYLNGNKQQIGGEKLFSKLTVRGNLHVLGPVNNISLENLLGSLVTVKGPQTITGPLTFTDEVAAERLTIHGPVNGINLNDLFADAVVKSAPQAITGTKTFTNPQGLEVTGLLDVKDDVQTRGPVGGIQIDDLKTVVTHQGRQEIGGLKTVLNDVHVAGNVNLKGKLNGLRIPQDLVLSGVPEFIPGKTILAGPAAIRGNLDAKKVNDVDLDALLKDRVTLDGDQNLRSELVFEDDVHVRGNFEAQRMNSIPREAIVTQSGRHVLRGVKTFVKPVEVRGNLKVASINGLGVENLSRDVVFLKNPQEIPQTTVFAAPVDVEGEVRVVTTLNGIDMNKIRQGLQAKKQVWNAEVEKVAKTAQEQGLMLRKQHESFQMQATEFAFFEHYQTLQVPSRRFLTGPIQPSARSPWNKPSATVAVAWTAWRTRCKHGDRCCEEYSTEFLEVDPSGKLAKTSTVLHRRYFPFLFQEHDRPVHGFYLWTNATSNKKGCESPASEALVITSSWSSMDESCHQDMPVAFWTKNSPFLSDAKSFVLAGEIYLVVASSFDKAAAYGSHGGHVDVYRYKDRWEKVQTLNVTAAVSLDVVEVSGTVLLSVACRLKRGPVSLPSVVYKWDAVHRSFVSAFQVPTSLPSATLFVPVDSRVACVFANEKSGLQQDLAWVDAYSEPVSVYEYTGDTFRLLQNIPLRGVNCMERFQLAGDSFLVLGSKHLKSIFIYRWRGYSKFEPVQTISVSPVHLHVYRSRTGDLLLAVSMQCGKTKVLRAVVRGRCSSRDSPRLKYLLGQLA